jgi:hypothetical protein
MGVLISKNPQGEVATVDQAAMLKKDLTMFEGLKLKFKMNPLEEKPTLKSLDGEKRVDAM